ncbi:DsbA family protein [Gillisia limnaea]|uniref:DSBA oxidoreductase n=1 Tax=Gillisia limnaea (strain DSM 15749 / LMG 21470 / R-8282) TaxID=865937 RepID=H2BU04_GILLR|nr:DsbA family protein [Gillisia limnaea]EHQ03818.1 DSBA oxidoreductase [Gillisia limnaea DSM 15749]
MKDTIFYFYDALCSWCYGFSPVLKKLIEKYGDELDFEVISGGMQTGDRKQPVSDIRDYLKGAYLNVTERTGVQFGTDFMEVLEDGNRLLNSVPAAVALSVVKELKPKEALNFASSIQRAIYYDGIDWNKAEAFIPYVEKAGIEADLFLEKFQEDTFLQKAKADFNLAANFGITGFPAVVLKRKGKYYLMAQGFLPFDQLEETLEKAKRN